MKRKMCKKSLFFSMLFTFSALSTSAQMIDLFGNIAVGNSLNANAVRSVGQLNQSLNFTQFLNVFQLKLTEIITTYFGDYQNMPVHTMNYQNMKIIFRTINDGHNFEALISPISQLMCQKLVNTKFDNLVYYRFISNGISSDYNEQQVSSNPAVCITSDAVALVFK